MLEVQDFTSAVREHNLYVKVSPQTSTSCIGACHFAVLSDALLFVCATITVVVMLQTSLCYLTFTQALQCYMLLSTDCAKLFLVGILPQPVFVVTEADSSPCSKVLCCALTVD